jgi:Adenylate and Guanylate cyclase catalytic domain
VEVHGAGDGRKVYWTLPPRDKTIRCGTVQRAKDYAKTAIARRRNHRYEPLAGYIATRRRTADRGTELEQALATIFFVDIVRSTEKAARLGDSRWTQVMNHYYAAVRRELKTSRGKEVVTTGDGLLATFGAPAAGVRCATAIREAVRTLGLGELESGDLRQMCEVSCGELGVMDRCIDVGVEAVEGAAQTRSVYGVARHDGGKTRSSAATKPRLIGVISAAEGTGWPRCSRKNHAIPCSICSRGT